MPELPEVETYRRFLNEVILHQAIVALEVRDAHVLGTPEDVLRENLVGRQVTATRRIGKNCFLELSSGQVLALHFGMSGDVGAYRHDHDAPRFTRVALHLADGLRVAFIDPRKFGRIRLTESVAHYQQAKKLGPDALDVTATQLQQRLSPKKTILKPLLLDQSITAGLGNWIVDEVLFQAKIHPERRANTLVTAEFEALHAAIQLVLTTAISHEATYRHFPASFLIHARGWDESATPGTEKHLFCPKHSKTKIAKSYVGGRATYVCPRCQPEPVKSE
ncbi:DNA-(apurinic or apyrimidinic site) lyase [Hymenobacter daecheongensis DSM 21074]|uniref:DNA-(Apurinic or apyrimidinic site) lyase n=1 Tax=Hymenobacter daecheongensis DSM 21074 TaxID=1121955 RepID=A0A1M6HYZ6_9BACT|nr:DNA-formamidopyrimidine glycosylase [Hymenobacter daecheongensis]SHJ27456.1 DNA-(apurinic or apyrimidinic site) lyase [Hymenobacter daecheongensis DSM 21074]